MQHQFIKVISAVAIAVTSVSLADVVPAALFTDHMVIQRETQAPVWGSADAGEKVSVTGSWGESAATTADASGKWMVKLKTPEAGGPHTLTLKGNNTVEIKDVLSGEVWFCSGQSNMEWRMEQLAKVSAKRTTPEHIPTANYVKKEMETASDALLRQFTVAKTKSPHEAAEHTQGNLVGFITAEQSWFFRHRLFLCSRAAQRAQCSGWPDQVCLGRHTHRTLDAG